MSIMDIVCVWRWPELERKKRDWELIEEEISKNMQERIRMARSGESRERLGDVIEDALREVAERGREPRAKWRAEMELAERDLHRLRIRKPCWDGNIGCVWIFWFFVAIFCWGLLWPKIADYLGWAHQ